MTLRISEKEIAEMFKVQEIASDVFIVEHKPRYEISPSLPQPGKSRLTFGWYRQRGIHQGEWLPDAIR